MRKFKDLLRVKEFVAELIGTFILTVLAKGTALSLAGLKAQSEKLNEGDIASLNGGAVVSNLVGSLAGGLGVMIGILVTGGASGGHLNPAVSVAMTVGRRMKATLLPAYLLGQFIGAAVGSALVLCLYSDTLTGELDVKAEVITSYAGLATNHASLVLDQVAAPFLLLLLITAVVEQGHQPGGLLVGLSVFGIGVTLGPNAGASMNPAVDFMPRVVAALWEGRFRSEKGFWPLPLLVPFIGGILGVVVYEFCIVKLRKEERSEKELSLAEKENLMA